MIFYAYVLYYGSWNYAFIIVQKAPKLNVLFDLIV